MSRRTIKAGLWESFKHGAQDGWGKKKEHRSDSQPADRTRNEYIAEPYQYSALGRGPLTVRLVKLLQGTRQEDIAISLFETDLGECSGTYEALSYVWGDASEKTPISVDDKTLEIGANLRCALLNLRFLDKSRILWIDAICIDQGNIAERNEQVARMGEIYRQASQTIVWLGDQTELTAAAFAMIDDLAEEAISLALAKGPSSTDGTAEALDVVHHLNNLPTSIIERDGVESPLFDRYNGDYSIVHVVANPWWSRAWTIQEILLASRATVVAGRCAMDWDRFCTGGNHGLGLGLWMPLTMGIILDPVVMPYLSVQALRWQRRLPGPLAASSNEELLGLLIRCRFRRATDPRDKIYALLGLLARRTTLPSSALPSIPLPPLGIRPDYASPKNAVYAHVARQIMVESNTLDMLSARSNTTTDTAMPSWVPDWSVTDLDVAPLIHDALGRPRETHATKQSVVTPRFLDAGMTLVLEAHEVTTVAALAPPLARIQIDSVEVLQNHRDALELDDSLSAQLARLGRAWTLLGVVYESLMSVVPHLATYAEWETFARAFPPTNPTARPHSIPCSPPNSQVSKNSRTAADSSPEVRISSLIQATSNLAFATATALRETGASKDEEPDDPLCVYWQTLCTGTYADTDAAAAPGRGRKIATQQLFYSWRASLKPIRDLHRWHADRMLRPLGFVGYVRKTWRQYSDFVLLAEGTYERRLARGANGYLCLVPATAEVGDRIVLAKGGRVPLVLRENGESGCWRFVGDAYVHGIMDGQVWDANICRDYRIV